MEVLRHIQATALPFSVKPFIDITDTLPSRTPDPEPRRTKDQITHISIHHSAVEGATIESYANYHVNTLGWAHIGYHFVIKGDQAYQTNDLSTFSYHTSSNNSYTVSVSISGDLSKRPLSEVERNNLYAVILTYMSLFNIPVENVLGHNEYPSNNTSCPCIDMVQVRNDIRTLQNKISYTNSPQYAQERAFKIANQILFFYNLAQGKNPDGTAASPGNIEWGKNVLLELDPFMTEKGLL
ncbi:peptidoglycan recognition protein family protein [Paenibacillus rigui]|uniref:N-acetylmuramoyl-L-alanine amidase domain-containing protein n=1 Tax=Paenibacillus rigui TaxID=554312 RepID=A0A229UKH3_9BACL|nr:peptidoglycan recognition family protein [Paenibacillus rigui]OXM83957.1 hypothetical protein CF651_22860 [Paenibacillus rigui]